MHPDSVDWRGFCRAREKSFERMSLLESRYPELRAWLVISSPTGQANLDDSIEKMAGDFPALLVDGDAKDKFIRVLREGPPSGSSYEVVKEWRDRVMERASELEFDGTLQVEIRFHDLRYDLVARLQADPLVDRERTPQTGASIRIVLGTLASFADSQTRS